MSKRTRCGCAHLAQRCSMRLSEYLAAEKIEPLEFARRLRAHHSAVYRYLEGKRIPRPAQMRRIEKLTGGKVTPADFYASPRKTA